MEAENLSGYCPLGMSQIQRMAFQQSIPHTWFIWLPLFLSCRPSSFLMELQVNLYPSVYFLQLFSIGCKSMIFHRQAIKVKAYCNETCFSCVSFLFHEAIIIIIHGLLSTAKEEALSCMISALFIGIQENCFIIMITGKKTDKTEQPFTFSMMMGERKRKQKLKVEL